MTTKEALSQAMNTAAGYTNRVRCLLAISQEMPEAQFQRLVGQHPDTMERDLAWAREDFERIKESYEAHCREIGEPAYSTYNED